MIEQVESEPDDIAITFERFTYLGELVLVPVHPLLGITDEHSPFPNCPYVFTPQQLTELLSKIIQT